MDLKGRAILVTGASRGIGAATASLAAEQGAHVIAHYNSEPLAAEALAADYGADRVLTLKADLSDAAQVAGLWQQAVDWRGGLDGLVNNAATMPYSAPGDAHWDSHWGQSWSVNVKAVADLCALATLHERRPVRLVNVASRAAFRGDMPDAMHYAASKGAVVALTRSLAKGYAQDQVFAFIVAPGWVKTERVLPRLSEKPEAMAEIPMGEAVPPTQVARLICFLLSGQLDHSTGGTFDINGGSYFH